MECKPKEIRFRLHQSRYIDVVISEEMGFDMPTTIQGCIDVEHEIQNNPEGYTEDIAGDWIIDENNVQNLEFLD